MPFSHLKKEHVAQRRYGLVDVPLCCSDCSPDLPLHGLVCHLDHPDEDKNGSAEHASW